MYEIFGMPPLVPQGHPKSKELGIRIRMMQHDEDYEPRTVYILSRRDEPSPDADAEKQVNR